jgi:hypothetical protein
MLAGRITVKMIVGLAQLGSPTRAAASYRELPDGRPGLAQRLQQVSCGVSRSGWQNETNSKPGLTSHKYVTTSAIEDALGFSVPIEFDNGHG